MKYNLKGNKIYFDEFFYLDLNKQTILEFDLKKRDEISEVEYRELVKRRVESMGYFLLGKRDYSERELYQKLLSKYREKDIIKKHMWPLTISAVPMCREAWIVTMADKWCSLMETFHVHKGHGALIEKLRKIEEEQGK